jgi:hypothetical protein
MQDLVVIEITWRKIRETQIKGYPLMEVKSQEVKSLELRVAS